MIIWRKKQQKNESCIFNEEIIHSTEIILAVTNAKERKWMSGCAVGSILEVPGRVQKVWTRNQSVTGSNPYYSSELLPPAPPPPNIHTHPARLKRRRKEKKKRK